MPISQIGNLWSREVKGLAQGHPAREVAELTLRSVCLAPTSALSPPRPAGGQQEGASLVLAVPFASCAAFNILTSFCESQFCHLYNGE